MSERLTRALLIVDPQNCFTNDPRAPLPVEGAKEDLRRVAKLIIAYPERYDEIVITIDTHTLDHISHAIRWLDADGNHPAPFTIITFADYRAGKWRATNPADQKWQGEYLRLLESHGRVHTIWPVHGQEGTWEHEVYDVLKIVLHNWEQATGRKVQYVKKGMHRDTEQFGVFMADVTIEHDPSTHLNWKLIERINSFDALDVVGEASSHCVMDSVKQYLNGIPSGDRRKVTVLRDCMSPVSAVVDGAGNVIVDFPAQAEAWLANLPAQGVAVSTVAELMAA